MKARQRSTSATCSSIESQFFSHMATGAIDEASRVRGNPDSRLDTNSLSCQERVVVGHVLLDVPGSIPRDERRHPPAAADQIEQRTIIDGAAHVGMPHISRAPI